MRNHVWTDQQITGFWDYESNFPENYWGRNCAKGFQRYFDDDLRSAKIIVDVGCGDGALLKELLQNQKFQGIFFGIEPSSDSRNKCNENLAHLQNFGGVFESVDEFIRSNPSPDLVLVTEVIEHLYDNYLNLLLLDLEKLAGKKSKIIFTTPNREVLEDNNIYNPIDGSVFHRWQHVRNWTPDTITEKLSTHFKILTCEETIILWYNSNIIKNLYRRLKYTKRTSLFCTATKKI